MTYKVKLNICGKIYDVDDLDNEQCVCDTAFCADYGDLDLYSFERRSDHIYVVTDYIINVEAESSDEARDIAENIATMLIDSDKLYCGELEDISLMAVSTQKC